MLKETFALLCGFVLSLGLISCEKLERVDLSRGPLPFEQAKMLDAIPLEYGELVAVIRPSGSRYKAVLWFKKPDKTIVVVTVTYGLGVMAPEVLTIPRR